MPMLCIAVLQIMETIISLIINLHFVQKICKSTETIVKKQWEGSGWHKGRYHRLKMTSARGGSPWVPDITVKSLAVFYLDSDSGTSLSCA